MSWVAAAVVVGAGAVVGSGVMQSGAAAEAAELQDKRFGQSLDATERARRESVASLAPFRSLGINTLSPLSAYLGLSPRTAVASTNAFGGVFQKYAPDQVAATLRQIAATGAVPEAGTPEYEMLSGAITSSPTYSKHPLAELLQGAPFSAATSQELRGLGTEVARAGTEFQSQLAAAEETAAAIPRDRLNLPDVPGLPPSLLAMLSGDNPAFQRYRALLDTPTSRFQAPAPFAPTPYTESEEFLAKKALGEKYANRDLAARGLFSSGRATEVLNDFVSKLLVEDSDRQFGRQLSTYNTNFNRALTGYGLDVEAADRDILRAESGVNADRTRETIRYGLTLDDYSRRFNEAQTRYANLLGMANLGANAASGTANVNTSAGATTANTLVAQGQAQAQSLYRMTQPYADAVSSIGKGAVTAGTLYGMGAFKGAGGVPMSPSGTVPFAGSIQTPGGGYQNYFGDANLLFG